MTLQAVNEQNYPELFGHPTYRQVISLLGEGMDSSIHVGEICKLTGLTDRETRKVIETIRRGGIVVITDQLHGYWLPETKEELWRYINQEERRGRSTFYTLKTARQLYSALEKG